MGATGAIMERTDYEIFQSTLPAGGGGRLAVRLVAADTVAFQSTLPAGGATAFAVHIDFVLHISIHAPREGSDR